MGGVWEGAGLKRGGAYINIHPGSILIAHSLLDSSWSGFDRSEERNGEDCSALWKECCELEGRLGEIFVASEGSREIVRYFASSKHIDLMKQKITELRTLFFEIFSI